MMGGRLSSLAAIAIAASASDAFFDRMPPVREFGYPYGYRSNAKKPSKAKARRRAKAKAAGKARAATKRARP